MPSDAKYGEILTQVTGPEVTTEGPVREPIGTGVFLRAGDSCTRCGGSGEYVHDAPKCAQCGGTGVMA
jgi:DnaJ-class molecular chaperone